MKLRTRYINFEAGGKAIIVLNRRDAGFLGMHSLDRAKVSRGKRKITAIVDVTDKMVRKGEIGANNDVIRIFRLESGDMLDVTYAAPPKSVSYIKQKINGYKLDAKKMRAIVNDVVSKSLSDIEMTAFVSALDIHGISMDEAEYLSRAMIETGKKISIRGKKICDKHSIGGIPGDKTTLMAVPIIAAAGLTIPKTSSRAITSPAGTADRMEVLAPVSLSVEEIKKAVKRANGCIAWGGALDLAPADDAFIKIEYPLGIDPLLLPSIMSKKKAVGSQYVVIDIPTGRGAKIKTIGQAHILAGDFIELGRRLGMHVACAITFGEQPLGAAMGPALEAQEALLALKGRAAPDLLQKVTHVVGILFELLGRGNAGSRQAMRLIRSGKAERKMRQIIAAQGGDEKVRASDLPIGKRHVDVRSERSGRVLWIKNAEISEIARSSGAPKDIGAGIRLHAKIGDQVKKGQKLFTIYSNTAAHLNRALKMVRPYEPIVVAKRLEDRMLISKVPAEIVHRRMPLVER